MIHLSLLTWLALGGVQHTTVEPPQEQTSRGARRAAVPATSRWFYVGIAIAALVVIAIGFVPSFSKRPSTIAALAPHVIVHATLFMSWTVLFLVQAALVATGHTRVHRRLGVAAAAIAVTMVVTAPPMAISFARRGLPPGDPLANLLVLLVDPLLFAVFVGAGILYRRRAEAHKRLMLLAMVCMLPPAISRWPIAVRHPVVVFPIVLLTFLGAPLVHDFPARRRPHPVSLWGGLVLFAAGPLRIAFSQSAAGHDLARWLIR